VPLFPRTRPFKPSSAGATSFHWSTLALLLHSTSSQVIQPLGFLKTLGSARKGSLGHAWRQAVRVPFGRSDRLPPCAPTLRPPGAPVGLQTGEKSASPPLLSADSVSSRRQRHTPPGAPAWAWSVQHFSKLASRRRCSHSGAWRRAVRVPFGRADHLLPCAPTLRPPGVPVGACQRVQGSHHHQRCCAVLPFHMSCRNELFSESPCQSFVLQGSLQEGEIRDCS
jgi:hypothetical protein